MDVTVIFQIDEDYVINKTDRLAMVLEKTALRIRKAAMGESMCSKYQLFDTRDDGITEHVGDFTVI